MTEVRDAPASPTQPTRGGRVGRWKYALATGNLPEDPANGPDAVTRWIILGVYAATCLVVALYLLNFFRHRPGALRIVFAAVFLTLGGFAIYGLTGKPLGLAETIIPPPPIHGTTMAKALEEARKQGRPLFIEFTGVT